jgi:hypothetical protein
VHDFRGQDAEPAHLLGSQGGDELMDALTVIPLLLLLGAIIVIVGQHYEIKHLTEDLAEVTNWKRFYKALAGRKTMLEHQPPPAASVSVKEFQEVIIGRDASPGFGYSTPSQGPGLNLVGGREESGRSNPQELPHWSLLAPDLPSLGIQAVNP